MEQKIYDIAKNYENVYECGVMRDGDCISLSVLFEVDDEKYLNILKKVCIKIVSELDELRGFEINPIFCEAIFYLL